MMSGSGRFGEDTRVEQLSELVYSAELVDGWDIFGMPNGGYVAAMMVRAMVAASSHKDPVSTTHHYLRPAKPGPVEIHLVKSRQGRTLSTVSGVLVQDGSEIIRSIATLATFDNLDGPHLFTAGPPDLASPDECVRSVGDEIPNFVRRLDLRHDPRWAGYVMGEPSGEPKMAGWVALDGAASDAPMPDSSAITMFADCMPPTIFNTDIAPGWAPTVELTVHYRNRPASQRLAVTYTTRFITGGMMSGDVELWDEEGTLVAEARQLALIPLGA